MDERAAHWSHSLWCVSCAVFVPAPGVPMPPDPRITPRQQEIFEYIVLGLSRQEIADRMGCTVQTVINQLKKAYERLEVQGAGPGGLTLLAALRVLGRIK